MSKRSVSGSRRQTRAAAFASQVRDLGASGVLAIGLIQPAIISAWKGAVTRRVVLTGERRRHYLQRHPGIREYETSLRAVVLYPDEVHRNKKDPEMAIMYKQLDAEAFLRVALWVSDTTGLENSVHSFRRAHAREVMRGRKEGRLIWEQD